MAILDLDAAAEGWGFCISDAMAHGNLVIATGFSGNMDYMNAGNSVPVDFTVEVIRKPETRARFGFFDGAPRWAYIDEDDLRYKLRAAHDEWNAFAGRRASARRAMSPFSADLVARRMLARLSAIPAVR